MKLMVISLLYLLAPKGAGFLKISKLEAEKLLFIIALERKDVPDAAPHLICHRSMSGSLNSGFIIVIYTGYLTILANSISSSVPSIAFEIPHFLKDRTTISDGMFCHVSFTHSQTVVSDAALVFLAAVKVFSPLIIHCVHFSLKTVFERLV